MTDSNTPSPLAVKALQRLQKLAAGNNIIPKDIILYSAEENTYDIEGTITLSPLFETQNIRHPGGPSARSNRTVGSSAELKTEIEKLRKDFETRHTWINEAILRLKEQPAEGWGLDDVMVTLPAQSVVLSASEMCPSCQGRKSLTCNQCQGTGTITCPQCQGNRQELCHICLGSGENPAVPSQPCIHCNGFRYAPCRYCQGHGQLTCPTCHGNRGTVCSACNGAGLFTEEVSVTCGARTHFTINAQGLPSGLRRGLDRLGMAKLADGHADIETITPPPEEDNEIPIEVPLVPGAQAEPKKEKPPKPEIHYVAHMPYADLRMNFAGKKAIVGIFGKKGVLLGVPPFLDTALEPSRQKLKLAIKGNGSLDNALTTRVIKDALMLQITSQTSVNALRRLYPLGLSQQVAAEILRDMRLALNRMTLRARSLVAGLCSFVGGGVFFGVFMTPVHDQITHEMSPLAGLAVDGGLLCAVLGASWFTLSYTTRFALQKRFPKLIIPITQKVGKTGAAMFAALLVLFTILLFLTPDKPAWLLMLIK